MLRKAIFIKHIKLNDIESKRFLLYNRDKLNIAMKRRVTKFSFKESLWLV